MVTIVDQGQGGDVDGVGPATERATPRARRGDSDASELRGPSRRRRYFAPTIPFSVADASLRAIVAADPLLQTAASARSAYNGRRVFVAHEAARGASLRPLDAEAIRYGWGATYAWGGVQAIAQGETFEVALGEALAYYAQGIRGSTVIVECVTDPQAETCERLGLLPWSRRAETGLTARWYTGAHAAAAGAVLSARLTTAEVREIVTQAAPDEEAPATVRTGTPPSLSFACAVGA